MGKFDEWTERNIYFCVEIYWVWEGEWGSVIFSKESGWFNEGILGKKGGKIQSKKLLNPLSNTHAISTSRKLQKHSNNKNKSWSQILYQQTKQETKKHLIESHYHKNCIYKQEIERNNIQQYHLPACFYVFLCFMMCFSASQKTTSKNKILELNGGFFVAFVW